MFKSIKSACYFLGTALVLCVVSTTTYGQVFKKKESTINKDLLQKAEEFFTEGVKEYELENYPKAFNAFEKTLNIDKNSAAANYMIAQIYNKQGNFFKAIPFAQKAVSLDENNKYYHLLLADTYNKKQDFNESAKVYLNLIKKLPNTAEYNYDLANAYISLNKYEDALKCFDRIEKAFGMAEEITKQKQNILIGKLNKLNEAILEGKKLMDAFPEETRFIILQVELLITNDKIAEAEKLVNELITKEPNNPFGLLAMSDILKSKGNDKKSQELLEQAFQIKELDLDAKIGILIGKVRQLPNDIVKEECLTLGEILVKVHPQDAKALAMYGDILTLSNKNKEALTYYLKSVKLDNSHYKIWNQVLILEYELGMIDSLSLHSEKSLELFPNQTYFWFYNGLANQRKNDYKKSTYAFEEGKKLVGNDRNMLLQFNTMLGDSYNGIKDYKKSDEAFEDALKIDENNHIVLNNYSYYLSLRKERLDYARKLSERVIKEDPENATYLDTYAWILYVMKDYDKAKEIFEKITDKTQNGTIIEHYGDVLYQLGQKDKALENWKKAKLLGEASDLIDKKIADKKLYE